MWRAHRDGTPSDFIQITMSVDAWMSGGDPYAMIGPGRPIPYTNPITYPFPAILFGLPFRFTPNPDVFFAAVGAGAFGWAAARRPLLWLAVPTPAWHIAIQIGQWAPLLVGASMVPWLGAILACKPSVGAALWAARPTRAALISGTAFVALSLVLLPQWPAGWLTAVREVEYAHAPVEFWGGPLALAALYRWRLPEARLLAVMACVPQTAHIYEVLALFLIPRNVRQGLLLAGLTWLLVVSAAPAFSRIDPALDPQARWFAAHDILGQLTVLLIYLPCTAMVLWPLSREPQKPPPAPDVTVSQRRE
jgi:hypothetical protein